MHAVVFTTDSWHVFRECTCGRVPPTKIDGTDIRLVLYHHRLHQDEMRNREAIVVDLAGRTGRSGQIDAREKAR